MPHNPNVCPTEAEILALYPVFGMSPYTEGFNAFEADVVTAAGGPYILTIFGEAFVHNSVLGDTTTITRDALLDQMDASPSTKYLATSRSGDRILMTSLVDGQGLIVSTNGGPNGTEMTLIETTPLVTTDIFHQAVAFAECLVCDWGCNTWNGCLAAAVHWLKLWRAGQTATPGATGQVTSMTQGPFSVSFATTAMSAASSSDSWWQGTPEGQQFLFLRKQIGPRPISLMSGKACQFGLSRGNFRRSASARRFF